MHTPPLLYTLACVGLLLSVTSWANAGDDSADVRLVGERLRKALLDPEEVKNALAPPDRSAEQALATQRPDGSWADQDYADTNREDWKALQHLPRLKAMVAACYQPGSSLAGRQDHVVAGLRYWLDADPHNTNWWHNEIGVPRQVGEILLLLGDDAPPDLRARGVELMKRSKWAKWGGQNLVWGAGIQVMRGCLSDSPDVVAEAFDRMWQEIHVGKPGEDGIQADDSFHQHGPLIYCGGYGQGFTVDAARFAAYAHGTRFAIPADKLAILDAYVLDGQQWMIQGGQWDWGVTGRELIRKGKSARLLTPAVAQLAAEGGPRGKELNDCLARLLGEPEAPPLSGNRHYWTSDYMVHRRPGYLTSARMYSARTLTTDGYINGENKTSHHLADGATYVALTGREYVGIYPVWDWRLIPGTTVEQDTPTDPAHVSHKGTARFVGGVSDGVYGCAAMDLAVGDLRARKAWFYFDDEFVCLGAGITCPTDHPVYTSLNQCLLRGPVRTSATLSGDELPAGDHALSGVKWVCHDSVGYVFPAPAAVRLRNGPATGSWQRLGPWSPEPVTENVFTLWLDHGAPRGRGDVRLRRRPPRRRRSNRRRGRPLAGGGGRQHAGVAGGVSRRTGAVGGRVPRTGTRRRRRGHCFGRPRLPAATEERRRRLPPGRLQPRERSGRGRSEDRGSRENVGNERHVARRTRRGEKRGRGREEADATDEDR